MLRNSGNLRLFHCRAYSDDDDDDGMSAHWPGNSYLNTTCVIQTVSPGCSSRDRRGKLFFVHRVKWISETDYSLIQENSPF